MAALCDSRPLLSLQIIALATYAAAIINALDALKMQYLKLTALRKVRKMIDCDVQKP